MWWSSNNNRGGSTIAKMLVRMMFLPSKMIKQYYYDVDCPSWAFVMMMMILIIVENHFAFIEL